MTKEFKPNIRECLFNLNEGKLEFSRMDFTSDRFVVYKTPVLDSSHFRGKKAIS